MYLETILILKGKKDTVRAIDVAEDMGFSKPSVSRGLSILKEELLHEGGDGVYCKGREMP